MDSKLKSIESVDKNAAKLLTGRSLSVEIDPELVEGIISEMHSEIEEIKELASFQATQEKGDSLAEPLQSPFSHLSSLLTDVRATLPDLAYNVNDTRDDAQNKLNLLQVDTLNNVVGRRECISRSL